MVVVVFFLIPVVRVVFVFVRMRMLVALACGQSRLPSLAGDAEAGSRCVAVFVVLAFVGMGMFASPVVRVVVGIA